jgi:hypothetical protein
MVGQQGCEQQGQVDERPGEGLARGLVAVALVDQPGVAEEDGVEHGRDTEIQHPAHADGPG